jgi:hypothetical protein
VIDSRVTVRNQLRIHPGIRVRRATAEVMCQIIPQLYIVEDHPELIKLNQRGVPQA